jgi:hypothetical protein
MLHAARCCSRRRALASAACPWIRAAAPRLRAGRAAWRGVALTSLARARLRGGRRFG